MSERERLAPRALALAAELDASFGRPRERTRPAMTQILAIRIGETPYALRLAEIQALLADRPIARLPSPVGELLGLCAIRGTIVPVYDLARLLGRTVQREHAPRWLVLAHRGEQIALAFDALDAQVHVPSSAIASPAGDADQDSTVLVQGALRPLLRVAAVLDAIDQRVRPLQEP